VVVVVIICFSYDICLWHIASFSQNLTFICKISFRPTSVIRKYNVCMSFNVYLYKFAFYYLGDIFNKIKLSCFN
jgi:hypothetical protein